MAKLTYRDLNAADTDALHAIVSHWSVVRQLGGFPWPASRDFSASRCKPFEGNGFVWGVYSDDCLIGSIGFTGGSIGYMFRPDVHGQGFGTQALRATLTHAFDIYPVNSITATTWHDNPASYGLLRKHGFIHYQTYYEHALARRIPTLSHAHRLTRAAWDRLSRAAQ